MTNGRPDHKLPEHAAEAKTQGRVLDVVALQMPSGDVPHHAALDAAREVVLEGPGVLAAFAATATIPGTSNSESAGIVLAVRQGSSTARPVGTAVARATGLFAGVATSNGHGDASFDDLVAVAMEGLGVARSDGGDQAVHSELYELVQVMRGRNPRPIEYSEPAAAETTGPAHRIPTQPPLAEAAPASGAPSESAAPSNDRGIRTESDDPFAYVDTRDDALNDARAAALTRGIAPGDQELAELARSHIEERDALRDELVQLRMDKSGQLANDVQERRIQKLVRQLEAAEGEIDKLRSHQEGDPGLASFFSSVQGLDPNEPNARTKRGMLDKVFRKNTSDPAAASKTKPPAK